jgi:glycogen(starch) synthase
MKVLMLGWELPPHNSGGLGVACLELTRALAASGADIEFVLPYYPDNQIEHMRVTSIFSKTVDISSLISAYDSQSYLQAGKSHQQYTISDQQSAYEEAVGHIAMEREFEIIHAHDWLTFRAALAAKWISGKPLVLHLHSIERDRAGGNQGSPLVREIEATAMLLADQIIAVSEHTKQFRPTKLRLYTTALTLWTLRP